MSFEVASVKASTMSRPPSYPLDIRNAYTPGSRFAFTFPLRVFIVFAYKIPPNQADLSHVAAWAANDELFAIDARVEGNPTKDQVRLMMQSLLADRFKLAVHMETREVPVFDLVLAKPGKTGPKLIPHSQGPPCPDSLVPLEEAREREMHGAVGDAFPLNCETAGMQVRNGMRLVGSRNSTVPLLANAIYSYGAMAGEVDRSVVDKTGLDGSFDFTIEYRPGENDRLRRALPNAADAPSDPSGTPFLNALREQLGLKLDSSKGPIQTLVVDHVERPSAN